MTANLLMVTRLCLIGLSLAIFIRCLRSMLRDGYENETWAYIRAGSDLIPVHHWENLIGKARGADIRVRGGRITRFNAVLTRDDSGIWSLYHVFEKDNVWVNNERVPDYGVELAHGDVINMGGCTVHFMDIDDESRRAMENRRTAAGKAVSPALTLLELTLFQALLILEHVMDDSRELQGIILAYVLVIILEWGVYNAMRLMNRSGYETEILAFYLTTLGLCVTASSSPTSMYKQMILIVISVLAYIINGFWLRRLSRTNRMRVPVAIFALGLLALNVAAGSTAYGASNWLSFGGYSFQPSEFVKAAFVYVGAATLESLYRKNNLYIFIAFSAACVAALALMGDFGTAVIFFATFLVISFMRSGSIATVFLAVTGAGMAGFLVLTVKPYIAKRFASWGHVWEDVYDTGYQQTRAMSAAASGGLLGKGAGKGWLKNIFAADTDMVFAMICEELGLVIALCMVFAMLLLAFFAVRSARRGRSAWYSIAACATVSMLLIQMSLNVFGSLDILPFTGVTFPFVSKGGSSLISCWMMMAFIKSADMRRDASFAVRRSENIGSAIYVEYEEDEDEEYGEDEE